jgi:hypothetical protein
MNLQEMELGHGLELARNKERWRALVNVVMNL